MTVPVLVVCKDDRDTFTEGTLLPDNQYTWGKAARIRLSREYLGLTPIEMAVLLRMAERSYKALESGRAAIPQGVWADIQKLTDVFDKRVTELLEKAGEGELRVRVWRGETTELEGVPSGMWRMIVAQAMQDNPNIEPYFPEDTEES